MAGLAIGVVVGIVVFGLTYPILITVLDITFGRPVAYWMSNHVGAWAIAFSTIGGLYGDRLGMRSPIPLPRD